MDNALLFTKSEIQKLREALESKRLPALYQEQIILDQVRLRPCLGEPPQIPGQGEAGGAEHTRHKQNYQQLHLASQLWLVTEHPDYLAFVRAMLLGYADIYESLPSHVSKDSNPPGRLFHQCLNESMWLLYGSDAYSNVRDALNESERRHIEQHLLVPMVQLIADHNADDFDVIHNHGIWSVAAGAFAGLVLGVIGIRQTLYLNAFLLVEMAKVAVRLALSPSARNLRPLPVSDAGAKYLASRLNFMVGLFVKTLVS